MTADTRVLYEDLGHSDLICGAVYCGGSSGTLGEEPLWKLMGCGNMGGFRIVGGPSKGGYKLVVLYTHFRDADWPDAIDRVDSLFHYYGDNKKPGRDLHDTPRGGNQLLRHVFEAIHVRPPKRESVPPFFVFSGLERGRDVRFLGLAAPGARGVPESEDLVAAWTTRGTSRFLNYKATFSFLEAPRISRPWIDHLLRPTQPSPPAPEEWARWVQVGHGPPK